MGTNISQEYADFIFKLQEWQNTDIYLQAYMPLHPRTPQI